MCQGGICLSLKVTGGEMYLTHSEPIVRSTKGPVKEQETYSKQDLVFSVKL